MPVPKKRHSRTRSAMRRAHSALSRTFSIVCNACGAPVIPHRVCGTCGSYRGKQVGPDNREDSTPVAPAAE